MYYATIKDLPHILQETLPADAQELYLKTYNQVWDEFPDMDESSRSTDAHQMAWDTMNAEFTKVQDSTGSHWYHKGQEPKEDSQPEPVHKKSFLERIGLR